jgi:putative membrane protein
MRTPPDTARQTPRDTPGEVVRSDASQPDTGRIDITTSPDIRILSILHAKNQEEIELGRLAQEKGLSDDVRRFGEDLVSSHSENDRRVLEVATTANATLLEQAEVKEMMRRERGASAEPAPDHLAELRALEGEAFDRAFAQKMQAGHRELIRTVEKAQERVRDENVRDLLARTLPVLREHEQTATRLASR